KPDQKIQADTGNESQASQLAKPARIPKKPMTETSPTNTSFRASTESARNAGPEPRRVTAKTSPLKATFAAKSAMSCGAASTVAPSASARNADSATCTASTAA